MREWQILNVVGCLISDFKWWYTAFYCAGSCIQTQKQTWGISQLRLSQGGAAMSRARHLPTEFSERLGRRVWRAGSSLSAFQGSLCSQGEHGVGGTQVWDLSMLRACSLGPAHGLCGMSSPTPAAPTGCPSILILGKLLDMNPTWYSAVVCTSIYILLSFSLFPAITLLFAKLVHNFIVVSDFLIIIFLSQPRALGM